MTLEQLFPSYKDYKNLVRQPVDPVFIAQVAHESGGFKFTVENLNYSAAGLLKVFPKYYNTVSAAMDARQPEKIANRVYGNRMGNNQIGDGWKFRGRGLIQITGRTNYMSLAKWWHMTIEQTILHLGTVEGALGSAYWFWDTHGCNGKNITETTKIINGGTNGLAARISLYNEVLKCL